MEKYNTVLFLIVSFWIFKYKAAQETAKQSSGDARVIGLLVGFFSLLGFIAIFAAIWCYCCHYENNKSKDRLPVRTVSVRPMVLPDKTPSTSFKPQDKTDDSKTPDDLQPENIILPGENRIETDDDVKHEHNTDDDVQHENNTDDGTQLESYRQ